MLRVDQDPAAVQPGCRDAAPGLERHTVGSLEHDAAIGSTHRGIGDDHSAVPDQAGIRTARTVGELAQVERAIRRCRDLDLHAGRRALDHAHRVARREDDVAVWRRDHALIFDRTAYQVYPPARTCPDAALIEDRRSARRIASEVEASGDEILIRQTERRGHQTADIDLRAGTEHDAVWVDQEYLAIRLQRTEYARRVCAHHPVQNRARSRLLDEARRLTGVDRKLLPVDDGARAAGDRQQVAAGGERDLAVDDDRSGWKRVRKWRCAACSYRERDETGLQPAAGNLSHFHPQHRSVLRRSADEASRGRVFKPVSRKHCKDLCNVYLNQGITPGFADELSG